MQKSLNFTFEIRRPPYGAWGFTYPNGTLGGMVGMVNRSEVDFAIGPFAVFHGRHLVIDYTHTIYMDTLKFFLSLKPKSDPFAIFRPFGWRVWLSIISVTPLYWLSIAIADVKGFSGQKWMTQAGFIIRQLLKQPSHLLPHQKLNKIIFITTWLLASLVLSCAYAGG